MDTVLDKNLITIGKDDFVCGSLKRMKFLNSNRKYLYKYRDIKADFLNGNNYCKDLFVEKLKKEDKITYVNRKNYYNKLENYLRKKMEDLDITEEEMYEEMISIRLMYVGEIVQKEVSESAYNNFGHNNELKINGIDQRHIYCDNIKDYSTIHIMIDELKYLEVMTSYYNELKSLGKTVKLYVKKAPLYYLEVKEQWLSGIVNSDDIVIIEEKMLGYKLNELEAEESSALLCFGEWYLGAVKGLNIDAYIYCTSEEIITRDACNTCNKEDIHFIYVPISYDLINQLQVTEISIANYRILSWLYEKLGKEIYNFSFDKLLKLYPNYFINYKSDQIIDYIPLDLKENFYKDRIQSVFNYAQKHMKGVEFVERECFDKNNDIMRVVGVTIDETLQQKMKIVSFQEATDIRKYYREQEVDEFGSGFGIVSNFLFFSTDISLGTYNKLLDDKPKEQYFNYGWHLDYKYDHGVGTVPLYNKACVTLNRNGMVTFDKKELKDGWFSINGNKLEVNQAMINIEQTAKNDDKFIIYTPMLCDSDSDDFRSYSKLVGHNRYNLVYINNEVVAIRYGEVMLPNAGIVLSFNEQQFKLLLGERVFDNESYSTTIGVDCSYSSLNDELISWAYGGGMFLIENGSAAKSEEELLERFGEEGWLKDLSKQTQGSLTYKNSKHPRTAIGRTSEGKFFIFVCTGRSKNSVGADYIDLINIAGELYGDIDYLMNIDGGASSFIGITINGEVIPLTDITYTDDSAAGEIRTLNSILSIEC